MTFIIYDSSVFSGLRVQLFILLQISDVMTLASEVKNLTNAARQLEPYVVALSAADIAISQMHQQAQSAAAQQQVHPKQPGEEAAHLQSVLEHINYLHQAE